MENRRDVATLSSRLVLTGALLVGGLGLQAQEHRRAGTGQADAGFPLGRRRGRGGRHCPRRARPHRPEPEEDRLSRSSTAGSDGRFRSSTPGNAPISLAVLLDISGSMSVGGNIDRARNAVAVATTHLTDAADEAALFTFDSTLQEVVGFTKDLARLRRVSLAGHAVGQDVALRRDCRDRAGRRPARQPSPRRAGHHRRCRHRQSADAEGGVGDCQRDRRAGVPADGGPSARSPGRETRGRRGRWAIGRDLRRWQIWPAGRAGRCESPANPHTPSSEVKDLFAELRHQYLIIFEPGPRPGWHPLEIRTRKSDLVVHARGGYNTTPVRQAEAESRLVDGGEKHHAEESVCSVDARGHGRHWRRRAPARSSCAPRSAASIRRLTR